MPFLLGRRQLDLLVSLLVLRILEFSQYKMVTDIKDSEKNERSSSVIYLLEQVPKNPTHSQVGLTPSSFSNVHTCTPRATNTSVMGRVGDQSTSCEFLDKIPPRFDGHGEYWSYGEEIKLWMHLMILPDLRTGL